MNNRHSFNQSKGFVLPLVMIVLAIMTIIIMGLNQIAKTKIESARINKQLWHSELEIRNAYNMLLYPLLSGALKANRVEKGTQVFYIDNRPFKIENVGVEIQDIAGLVSLGSYNRTWLKKLLLNYTNSSQAKKISARLADWVDKDKNPQFNGMEQSGYTSRGLDVKLRNGPLRSSGELKEILGFNDKLYHQIRQDKRGRTIPSLRDNLIVGGVGWFNATTAPLPALMSILNFSPAEADAFIDAREQNRWDKVKEILNEQSPVNGMPLDTPSSQYRITLTTETGERARLLIKLTANGPAPYETHQWQFPDIY